VARANKQAEAARRSQRRATSDPTAETGPFQNESADGRAVGENVEDVDRVDADKPDEPAGRAAIIDEGWPERQVGVPGGGDILGGRASLREG
jgi:hypothetical protein